MKLLILTVVISVFAVVTQGCHWGKKDYPADNFPENGEGPHPGHRKKRHATGRDHANHFDADEAISKFFTKCMFERTGSFFKSWQSVVDFVLRDTRWYSASDEYYCPEEQELDRVSLACWKNRLAKLMDLDSKLLPKAQQCMEQFALAYKYRGEPIRGRGRRDVFDNNLADSSPKAFSARQCSISVPPEQYSRCVEQGAMATMNIRDFPSLRNYDEASVEDFVLNHYSGCRIQSKHNGYRNVYTEVCPTKIYQRRGSSDQSSQSRKQCAADIFESILRTASPIYQVATTCTKKYSDKCQGVNCGLYGYCDKSTGACVCNRGYQSHGSGPCTPKDPCSGNNCPVHSHCKPSKNGGTTCECDEGYEMDQYGRCNVRPRCHRYSCRQDDFCDEVTGRCTCPSGYQRDESGRCRRIAAADPCDAKDCQENEACHSFQNFAYCLCKSGYHKNSFDVCVSKDPCSGKNCPEHSHCKPSVNGGATCECDEGYEMDQYDRCNEADPCQFLFCLDPEICRVNPETKLAECVCKPGYELDRYKNCVVIVRDPCAGVKCAQNSHCEVERGVATCKCDNGYQPGPFGRCVVIDLCAGKKCAQNSHCEVERGVATCKCDDGYQPGPFGRCVVIDPCAGRKCAQNSHCEVEGGAATCKCDDGYQPGPFGRCVVIDPCAGKKCAQNSHCEVERGVATCKCNDGYQPGPFGRCVVIDPCAGKKCAPNSHCEVEGGVATCKCDDGFQSDPFGRCVAIDPCVGKKCAQNSHCEVERGVATCKCDDGYQPSPFGGCIKADPCHNVRCPKGKMCKVIPQIGSTECVCIEGYFPVEDGTCIIDACADKRCPAHSNCVNGKCQCESGYYKAPDGSCQSISSWGPWSSYSSCSVECGGGVSVSTRSCSTGDCRGDDIRSKPCQTDICVTEETGTWGPWTPWTRCSATCGTGERVRRRFCRGNNCQGSVFDNERCVSPKECTSTGCPPPKMLNPCPTKCPKTCQNLGIAIKCVAGCRDNVFCVCPEGMVELSSTDSTCIDIPECPRLDPCRPDRCLNRGKCKAYGRDYRCICPRGYSGKNCQISSDGCDDDVCPV